MSLSPRLALMLSVPPLLWAGNAVLGRMAIQAMAPLWLNASRWALALLLLLPLGWRALATADARAAIGRRWRYLALLSALGVGAYNALQYLALVTSTPLNITLIAASGPVWTMAIGALAYGERPQPAQLLGAVLSLAGVAVVLGHGGLATLVELKLLPGDLLMVLAVVSWSAYSWLLVRPPAHMRDAARPPWDWAQFLFIQILMGMGWATGAASLGQWIHPVPAPQVSPLLLAVLLYVAVGPSLVAYRLWGLGVAQAGPLVAGFVANLTPLFAALLSAALLGEWPQPHHGVAFALIVAGIVVSSRGRPAPSRP